MAKIDDKPSETRKGYRQRTQGVPMNAALGVDRESFAETWRQLLGSASAQPKAVVDAMWQLQQELVKITFGNSELEPDPKDGRFHDAAWQDNPIYRRLGQSYLAWCNALDSWLEDAELEGMNRERARFVLDASKDVLAPMNTLLGNPEAMRRVRETKGQNVLSGIRNFLDDRRNNHGYPAVADRDGFTVGKEVAATEGHVIFRSELLELISYQPKTPKVDAQPMLYVFSQVNRFYLGDLTPDRSMFQQLIADGITVYAISWRNPTPEQRDWNLDTYAQGIIESLRVIRQNHNKCKVNLMGVCAGGLTAAAAAGVLKARGKNWLNSLSLFINVLDNRTKDSDFGLFVSDRSVQAQKESVRSKGVYDEKDVFEMFAMLRWEENIMSFMRRNYLLGEDPLKHPLLFWSMDYTRVPAGLHSNFLDFSLTNKLAKNEQIILGKRVDLSECNYPVYLMAGSTDHITPWRACYRSTQLFGENTTFVLTNQNHTQTISARRDNKHLKYWINEQELPADPDTWEEGAVEHEGLWIDHWIQWLHDNSEADADPIASDSHKKHPPLDPAPGRYVTE